MGMEEVVEVERKQRKVVVLLVRPDQLASKDEEKRAAVERKESCVCLVRSTSSTFV